MADETKTEWIEMNVTWYKDFKKLPKAWPGHCPSIIREKGIWHRRCNQPTYSQPVCLLHAVEVKLLLDNPRWPND